MRRLLCELDRDGPYLVCLIPEAESVETHPVGAQCVGFNDLRTSLAVGLMNFQHPFGLADGVLRGFVPVGRRHRATSCRWRRRRRLADSGVHQGEPLAVRLTSGHRWVNRHPLQEEQPPTPNRQSLTS